MFHLEYTLVRISCEALSSHFQRVRKQVSIEMADLFVKGGMPLPVLRPTKDPHPHTTHPR